MADRVMYQAVCATCGIDLKVSFKPDGTRPVLCQEHRAEQQRGGPAPKKKLLAQMLDLYRDTSGKIQVKFFFTSQEEPLPGIPEEEERQEAFPVIGGQRRDNGTCVIDADGVAADFLRTGLGNAEGHQWKLVFVGKWKQPITNPKARELYGEWQWVIKLTYVSNPRPEEIYFPTWSVKEGIRELASLYTWRVRVFQNDFGPGTINFTSPKGGEVDSYIVVRDGCVVLEKARQQPAEGTDQDQATAA